MATASAPTSEAAPAGDGPPPHRPRDGADRPLRRASAVAGIALLAMIIPAIIGNFLAFEGLVTPGEPARTTADISASMELFRYGIASLFAVVLLDVVVAVALHRVFRHVSVGVSMLAVAARLVYAGILMAAISNLTRVANLLDDPAAVAVLGPEQVEAQVWLGVQSYLETWSAGLLVFGLHLLALGWLAWRSGDRRGAPQQRCPAGPRILAVLLAVAGFGYAFDSVAAVVVGPGAPTIAQFTFLGEVVLAVWLIRWSRRLARAPMDRQGART